jgi:hypothetical protein
LLQVAQLWIYSGCGAWWRIPRGKRHLLQISPGLYFLQRQHTRNQSAHARHPNPLGLDRVPPEHAISTLPVQRIGKLQNCRFINSFRMMKTGEEEEEEEERQLP